MQQPTASITKTPESLSASAADLVSLESAFESGGKRIKTEIIQPRTLTNAPGIIVLHGAGGMDHGNRYVRQLASALAASGYATFLVRYFESTGTSYASDPVIYANFQRWLTAVNDAVTFAVNHPRVDTGRLALCGYSLGAYLGIVQAARAERIRAIIELAGGIDPEYAKQVQRLPPMLVIHGRNDQRVPFARALELVELLTKLHSAFETRFYPDEGHILSPFAAFDALGHAIGFLRKHL